MKCLRFIVVSTLLLALSIAVPAQAQDGCTVIWDSPPNFDLTGLVDQEFDDFPEFSTYLCPNVPVVDESELTSVTTYYTNASGLWPQGLINAVLNIVEVTPGFLPPNSYDPSVDGVLVVAEMAPFDGGLALTVDLTGAGVILPAGEYAIGLTPNLEFGQFGQEFHQGSDVFLSNTAGRNPAGGFGVGTDWFEAGPTLVGVDWGAAILVCGEPTAISCTTPLIADGGSEEIGTVTTELNDDGTWTVTYETTGSWVLEETHLHVACDSADFPQTGSGNPKVGRFDYSMDHGPFVQTFSYVVDDPGCCDPLFAAHAEAVDVEDCVEDLCREESAWGEGEGFAGRNWAMFFECEGDCDR